MEGETNEQGICFNKCNIYINLTFSGCSGMSSQNETTSGETDSSYNVEASVENSKAFSSNDILMPNEMPSLDIEAHQTEFDYVLNNAEFPDNLSALTDSQIEAIAQKQEDLFNDLTAEFKALGINVNVNRDTGEIDMDSTVLFGGDSADLTNDGKEFLNKFVKAYTSIIYNEKYDGFISKTMVEGHIAPVSGTTYKSGMPLSEKRAENVMNYCLSSETGADTSKLADTMETIGYSQSKPVYDSDGNVDVAASRRVSFRFIINI